NCKPFYLIYSLCQVLSFSPPYPDEIQRKITHLLFTQPVCFLLRQRKPPESLYVHVRFIF
ncbi:hypothetical protein MLN52_24870, partial [Escherichia coli]|nr:hypothetical protein [Escherichia coli]